MNACATRSVPAGSRAQSLLELILQASLEGVVRHDLVGGTCEHDGRFLSVLGFDPETEREEACSELWLQVTHPEDRDEVLALWADHIESGWPFQHTWRMSHCHGGYRWVWCRSTVRLDDRGTPVEAVSLFSDVTDHVETARRHQTLVEALPDTVLRFRRDGGVVDAHLSGRPSDVIAAGLSVGAILDSAIHGPVADMLRDMGDRCLTDQVSLNEEWSWDDGSATHHLELRFVPCGTDEVFCLARDVSEKKRMEQQLLQGQKLESIGQLAAGIAHEINTPLQFIGDNLQFLQKAIDRFSQVANAYREALEESGASELVERMHRAEKKLKLRFVSKRAAPAAEACIEGVERLAGIVAAMKEFSHPGSDRPAEADLNRALQSTVKISTHEWKNVAEVELDLDDSLPHVSCFVGEINQCFLNIIVNAAHALGERYGETREGRIGIQSRRAEGAVEIRIADNGPGIPDHVRERIFDPFFTTKDVGKGTGQGLSLARKTIVDRHGGALECESRLGKGTTFVVRLPLGATAQPSEAE